jgi:hypothetical protein
VECGKGQRWSDKATSRRRDPYHRCSPSSPVACRVGGRLTEGTATVGLRAWEEGGDGIGGGDGGRVRKTGEGKFLPEPPPSGTTTGRVGDDSSEASLALSRRSGTRKLSTRFRACDLRNLRAELTRAGGGLGIGPSFQALIIRPIQTVEMDSKFQIL